jgi:TPR repeat protein
MTLLRFCFLLLFIVLLPVIGYYYSTSDQLPLPVRDLERDRDAVAEKAEGGDAKAQFDLGKMYVPKDYKEAVKWWRKAADQGHELAQFDLGNAYDNGRGVLKDDKEALKWYRKAADQGHAHAQFTLGLMYANGTGVLKDPKEALKWYRKAADQEHANAQFNLGWMYENGQGVLKDPVTAYAWYSLSAFNGNEEGKEDRDKLAKKMTPEQIVEAQELSKELLKQIEENKKKAK